MGSFSSFVVFDANVFIESEADLAGSLTLFVAGGPLRAGLAIAELVALIFHVFALLPTLDFVLVLLELFQRGGTEESGPDEVAQRLAGRFVKAKKHDKERHEAPSNHQGSAFSPGLSWDRIFTPSFRVSRSRGSGTIAAPLLGKGRTAPISRVRANLPLGHVLVLLAHLRFVPRLPELGLLSGSEALSFSLPRGKLRPPLSLSGRVVERILRRENRLAVEVICGLRSVGSLRADVGVFSGLAGRVSQMEVEFGRLLRCLALPCEAWGGVLGRLLGEV